MYCSLKQELKARTNIIRTGLFCQRSLKYAFFLVKNKKLFFIWFPYFKTNFLLKCYFNGFALSFWVLAFISFPISRIRAWKWGSLGSGGSALVSSHDGRITAFLLLLPSQWCSDWRCSGFRLWVTLVWLHGTCWLGLSLAVLCGHVTAAPPCNLLWRLISETR